MARANAVVPGQHLAGNDPVADLDIALLRGVGVPTPAFGMDGTRPAGLSGASIAGV